MQRLFDIQFNSSQGGRLPALGALQYQKVLFSHLGYAKNVMKTFTLVTHHTCQILFCFGLVFQNTGSCKSLVLLTVKQRGSGRNSLKVFFERLNLHALPGHLHEILTWSTHPNPTIIKSIGSKVFNKSKVAVRKETLSAGFILHALRHF